MRCLILALAFGLWTNAVYAQDSASDITYDWFGVPEQAIKIVKPTAGQSAVQAFDFPDCNEPELLAEIQSNITANTSRAASENVVSRRSRLLALKNMKNFVPVDIKTIRPHDNPQLAAVLVSEKINSGLNDNNFKICAGDNPIVQKRVFLLLQTDDKGFRVKIINYNPHKVLSFIYKKTTK